MRTADAHPTKILESHATAPW